MKSLQLPHIKKIETIVQNNPGYISFAQGALRVGGVPLEARQYIQKILETDVADYYGPAAGILSLRKTIAHSYESVFPSITHNHVLISHGSIGAFAVVASTLLDAHDAVLLPTPTYPVYQNVIKSLGLTPINAPVYTFKDTQWIFDIEALKTYLTPQTKLLIISNPSNPLGLLLNQKSLEELILFTKQHNIYLVIDEAYDSFIFTEKKIDIMPYIEQEKHCIRLGSFSKNSGMSGWRIGYAISHPTIIEALIPTQDALLCCPNIIGQKLAEFMHTHQHLMIPSQQKVLWAKETVINFFTTFQEQGLIDFQAPEGGFYLFFRQKILNESLFIENLLTEQGVGLVPGSDFSDHTTSWARLCFAREPQILIEGLQRIATFFNTQLTQHTDHTSDYERNTHV